jgi:8-oxo-dGTP pyrophosphatase MutT (NUDIX family)
MTRHDLQALLDTHVPADAKETNDKAAMLDFLAHLPAPLSAGQQTAHFTASALVLDESRSRTCLVLHRKLGLWLQPGGHLEADDASIAAAALREVREETGLDGRLADEPAVHLDVHEIPERPEMPAHLHLDVRFVVIAAGDELVRSDESTDVRWWTIPEAAKAGDDSLARLIRAAI